MSEGTAESWLERALEVGGVVAWEWRVGEDQVRWYGDAVTLHGRSPDDPLPVRMERYLDLVHPDDRDRVLGRFRASLRAGGRYEISYRVPAADGEVRWLRAHGNVVRGRDDRPDRILGTLVDETAEQEAEEQLARSALHAGFLAELSEFLAEATPDPGEVLETVTRRVAAFLDATCLIRMLGDEAELLGPLVINGDRPAIFERASQMATETPVRSPLMEELAADPRVRRFPSEDGQRLSDVADDAYHELIDAFAPGPAVVVPMCAGGRLFGMILVARHEDQAHLDDHAVRLLTELGRLIELSIRNVMLVGSLRDELDRREQTEADLAVRMAQQRALVELSQRALDESDLPKLLDEAAEVVATTLDVPMAAVLELSPSGDSLLVEAGTGWPEDFVGNARLDTSETIAGLTIQRQEPVVVTGFAEDDPIPALASVAEFDIRSAITVLVTGPHAPYGVLGVYDHEPRRFDDRDAGFLRAVGNVVGSAVERFQTQQRFLQAQRMEAVGRIAGGIAHDFNNLLTIIVGYAEMLRPELHDSAHIADLDELRGAADQAAELVDNLLAFSRRDRADGPEVLDVGATVAALEPMLRRVVYERISLQVSITEETTGAEIDPGEMQQILLNLVINAGDAISGSGEIAIRVDRQTLDGTLADELGVDPGTFVSIEVADTGTGMDPDVAAQAMEPFYTTKPVGQGTGLGLSTVYGIVRGQGGAVRIDSQPGAGTTVRILLPLRRRPSGGRARKAAPRELVAPLGTSPPGDGGTILLVEDERSVRALTARALRERGYEVIEADSGPEAIELATDAQRVDLLVTDVVMPNMTGPELAAELRERIPDLTTLYVSGYSEQELPFDGVFVSKPYRVEQLARTIGLLLERSRQDG